MAKKVQVKDVYTGKRDVLTDSEYNRQMQQWAQTVQQLSKQQAALFRKGKRRNHTYKSGPKKGSVEQKLRNHIQYSLATDAGEVAGVGFKFPVHGIFREYGVGRGTPRTLVGHTARTMSDWLSGTLEKQEQAMVEIVAEYQSGKVVRVFNGVKK